MNIHIHNKLFILVVLIFFLAGCQKQPGEEFLTNPTSELPMITAISAANPIINPTETETPLTKTPLPNVITPTVPEFAIYSTELEKPIATITPKSPQPVNQEPALQITFPTPGQAAVSLWRPPLYDVPWSPGPFDHFYFVRPIAVDQINWPLPDYRYGATFFGPDIVHTGIDIDAPRGTPVLAAGPGKVTWAGNGLFFGKRDSRDPYGNAVVIQHDFGYQNDPLFTVYAHMDRINVTKGQRVLTGQQLGIVGSTGATTGPHLHFEVRIGKNSFFVTRNPELWLSPPQGWGILVGRLFNEKNGPLEKLDIDIISNSNDNLWKIRTYTQLAVNSDDYYHENLVLSDLPADDYQLEFEYKGILYQYSITIHAGNVSFFSFHPTTGFSSIIPTPDIPDTWMIPPTP